MAGVQQLKQGRGNYQPQCYTLTTAQWGQVGWLLKVCWWCWVFRMLAQHTAAAVPEAGAFKTVVLCFCTCAYQPAVSMHDLLAIKSQDGRAAC